MKKRMVLAVTLFLLLCLAGCGRQTAAVKDLSPLEQTVLKETNRYREEAGLQPLTFDHRLNPCAEIRSRECDKVFSHTRPDGSSFSTVLEECHVNFDAVIGENVGAYYQDGKEVVADFMASPDHRDNILDPEYVRICIACLESEEYPGYYVVEQLFMGPEGSALS